MSDDGHEVGSRPVLSCALDTNRQAANSQETLTEISPVLPPWTMFSICRNSVAVSQRTNLESLFTALSKRKCNRLRSLQYGMPALSPVLKVTSTTLPSASRADLVISVWSVLS